MTLCKQTRKRRYSNQLDARIVLARLQSSNKKKREESRVYHCEFCNGYHTTSQRKRGEE